EDALELEPPRVVAAVDDLVGAPGVRVVDDRIRVVLRRERGGRVVEVRPLQQELDGEVDPRLATMAEHEPQFGKVVADVVDQTWVLAGHRHARTGDASLHENRDVELYTLRVE